MYLLQTPQTFDPKINLAIEEHVVRNFDADRDLLFIYRNNPSLIIGKNQNPFEEVNMDFLETNNIEMFRRISGGGAVYHDLGNINFSYITKNTRENFNNYKSFLKPVIDLLNKKGIPAKINKRNDIVIDNLKISGNAQFTTRGKMFSHGTLLFNSDLDKINQSLDSKTRTIQSKSTKSVRSRITNIIDHFDKTISVDLFLNELVQFITDSFTFSGHIKPDKNQWEEIEKLVNEKYSSWEWNWGRTPKFVVEVINPYTNKTSLLKVVNCIIKSDDIDPVDNFDKLLFSLNGVRYKKGDIKQVINSFADIKENEKKVMLFCVFPF